MDLPELLHPIKMNRIGKVKFPAHHWYATTEVAIAVDSLCEPIFIGSAQLLTVVQLLTKLVSFAAL